MGLSKGKEQEWCGLAQRTWEKQEAKEKNQIILLQLLLPGAGGVCAHLPGASVPGHWGCRTAAGAGKGTCWWGLGAWERAGMSKSKLEVACSLLVS